MADTETPNLELTIQTIGGNNNTWGNLINDNYDRLDDKMGDTTSITTTGGTTVLTDNQEFVAIIEMDGTLLSNSIIQFTGRGGFWLVRNSGTDGAFTRTCKLSGQTGVVIPANSARVVFCDGTDIRLGNTDAALLLSALTLITAPAIDDLMLLGDTSNSGLASAITVANWFKAIALLSAVTAPAIDDTLALYDLSGTAAGGITLQNLLKVVGGLTEDATPDLAADFALSFDASATLPKKVKLANLVAAAGDAASGIIELAVKAEMETAADVVRAVVPGRQHFHPGMAKAWAFVAQGTTAITTDYGCASVSDDGTGLFTLTFDAAFSAAGGYTCSGGFARSVAGGLVTTAQGASAGTKTATTFQISTNSAGGSQQDSLETGVSFMGDQ